MYIICLLIVMFATEVTDLEWTTAHGYFINQRLQFFARSPGGLWSRGGENR